MTDIDMEMDMDMDDFPPSPTQETQDHNNAQQQSHDQPPVKIRKKPGRKPNPASPALRKAQNRAAQRAFRERKERHMRELEVTIKQIREQRDKLYLENEQLKADAEINRSENWYLKGIVLTLQLVCYQHNLAIPQHGPFVNDQALSVMAQSTPEPIAAYLNVNANSKVPVPTQLSGYRHSIKQRDRYLSSGSIVVTKDDVCQQQFPPLQAMAPPLQQLRQPPSEIAFDARSMSPQSGPQGSNRSNNAVHPLHINNPSASPSLNSASSPPYHQYNNQHDQSSSERGDEDDLAMPDLLPMDQQQPPLDQIMATPPMPRAPLNEPITSNLAAIQTLRLRLRLQSACARMDSVPFSIQPSILQLTIPHDPRIDLIPTPHMRDRMILFREQFDLDDVFKCLLSLSVFHGGDPSEAGNWQLPKVFFEKYWFLTIDYTLQRTTNRWRRLQGLNDLENDLGKEDSNITMTMHRPSALEKVDEDDTNPAIKHDDERDGSISSSATSWGGDSTTALSSEDSAALAGLPALEAQQSKHQSTSLPRSVNSGFGIADLSSYLGVEFSKLEQIEQQRQRQQQQQNQDGVSSSDSSGLSIPLDMPTSPLQHPSNGQHYATQHDEDSFEPIRLTNGYLLPQKTKNTAPTTENTTLASPPSSSLSNSSPAIGSLPTSSYRLQHPPEKPSSQDPWEKMLMDSNHAGYGKYNTSYVNHLDTYREHFAFLN
ncbi:hypothetical protein [Absidia glauca]|uniref:BZIP domain-containing protein n=1 Tax=Absidia glauca TaxID=4829 RepID=A0A168M995_ABSGL|nr:hypothetical protein [Absidia glauca]